LIAPTKCGSVLHRHRIVEKLPRHAADSGRVKAALCEKFARRVNRNHIAAEE
jgi:hypothetical protein